MQVNALSVPRPSIVIGGFSLLEGMHLLRTSSIPILYKYPLVTVNDVTFMARFYFCLSRGPPEIFLLLRKWKCLINP
jgi:hypothetical protein